MPTRTSPFRWEQISREGEGGWLIPMEKVMRFLLSAPFAFWVSCGCFGYYFGGSQGAVLGVAIGTGLSVFLTALPSSKSQ